MIVQLGPQIWWAYFTTQKAGCVEFEGDIFQGSEAEELAKLWIVNHL